MATRIEELKEEARQRGLYVATWSPGDGVTRYRFFDKPGNTYFGPANGVYTALGLKEAWSFVHYGHPVRKRRAPFKYHGNKLRRPKNPRSTPKQSRLDAENRLHSYLVSRGASSSEAAKEVRRLKSYGWASFSRAMRRATRLSRTTHR